MKLDALQELSLVNWACREIQLRKLRELNALMRAQLAYVKVLQARVRGTPDAHNVEQRGSTPRPATKASASRPEETLQKITGGRAGLVANPATVGAGNGAGRALAKA